MSVDEERLLEPFGQMANVRVQLVNVADRAQEKNELIASHSGQHIGGANLTRDPARDLHQQIVAGGVSIIIVDIFEIIDVDKGQSEFCLLRGGLDQILDRLFQQAAVGQTGEIVEIGATKQLVLQANLIGDVGRCRDIVSRASHDDRVAIDFDRSLVDPRA